MAGFKYAGLYCLWMEAASSMFRAGSVLLLVGAIYQAFSGLMLLALAVFFSYVLATGDIGPPEWIPVLQAILGTALIVGSIFALVAYARSRRGEVRGAWIYGIVGSLLPPVQPITLVGAILCLTSPEGGMQRAHPGPPP